jgi:hypothetical protein
MRDRIFALVPSHSGPAPSRSVGQLLWWVNFLLKQSVPTHRPGSVSLVAAGDPFPLVKFSDARFRNSLRYSVPTKTTTIAFLFLNSLKLRTRPLTSFIATSPTLAPMAGGTSLRSPWEVAVRRKIAIGRTNRMRMPPLKVRTQVNASKVRCNGEAEP